MRCGETERPLNVSSDVTPIDLVRELAPLSRTLVHDDNRRALDIIAAALPGLSVEAFPSGTPVWTWRIPNRWRLVASRLVDAVTGELLWDGMCHPLATVNYSLPIDGDIDRDTLARHLFSAPSRPDAIPFVFRFYNRDWGFCVPESRRREILAHERFTATIVADEAPDALVAGVAVLPGAHDAEMLVVSNICHPSIANDSITGVAAAVDLARHLASKPARKYTYRFLFVPETIGSIAYLAHHPEVIDRARGGFFSEMLGTSNTHCLQFSRQGDTYWDRVALATLQDADAPFRTAAFLQSAPNDEKILDSPGVDIPTISLTRYPYPEYHTSDDNAALIDQARLDESCRVIRALFDRIEADYVPKYLTRGPVCLSDHGLYPDWYRDPALKPAWEGFVKVMYALDERRSCEELAADLELPIGVVRHWTDAFRDKGFVQADPYIAPRS
jgi:aminopeptidase-like protein